METKSYWQKQEVSHTDLGLKPAMDFNQHKVWQCGDYEIKKHAYYGKKVGSYQIVYDLYYIGTPATMDILVKGFKTHKAAEEYLSEIRNKSKQATINLYNGQIAVVNVIDYRGDERQYIATVRSEFPKYPLNMSIGHPIDTNTKEMMCGGSFFTTDKLVSIKPATDDEKELWKKLYIEFHKDILDEKGYDWCAEQDIVPFDDDEYLKSRNEQ